MKEELLKKYYWIIISAAVVLVFIQVLGNDFVNYDDPFLVLENAIVNNKSWNGLGHLFAFQFGTVDYKPIVFMVFKVLYILFEYNPLPYHLFSLIIHVLNSILVYLVLVELFKKGRKGNETFFAIVGALLWSLNPLKVESVAWVSETEDVLYGMFYLIGVYAFLRFLNGGSKQKYWIVILFVSFILSFFSKALAITLPIVLLWIWFYHQSEKPKYMDWMMLGIPVLSLLVIGVIYLLLPELYQTQLQQLSGYNGMINPPEPLSSVSPFIAAIWIMFYKVIAYISRFLLPIGLSIIYPFNELIVENQCILYAAPFLCLSMIFIIMKFKHKIPKSYLGLGMFLWMLLPLFLIGTLGTNFVSDRYIYIPSLGLVILLLGVFYALTDKIKFVYLQLILGVVILFFGIKTYQRTQVWKSSETLFSNLISQFPNEAIGHNNLGLYLFENGDKEAAITYFNRALELNPTLQQPLMNRAIYRYEKAEYESALADLNQYVNLYPIDSRVYGVRGGVLAKMGETEKAIQDLKKAQELDRYSLDAYINLGKIYIGQEKYELAAESYQKYLNFYPKDAQMNYLKGVLEEKLGRYQESTNYISIAIQENPTNGRYYVSRAKAYYLLGQKENARGDVIKAEGLGVGVSQQFKDLLNAER